MTIIDFSYSAIMRTLRKTDKEKCIEFQKAFKQAFDNAFLEGLEDLDKVALMQAVQETQPNIKEAKLSPNIIKFAQDATDLGDPSFAGRAIAEIIKFLLRKIPYIERPTRLLNLKQKIVALDEFQIASKKSPSTSSLGQSITLVKTLLNGKDPSYIRSTLQQIVANL